MMTNYLSAIRFLSYVRLFSWPLYLAFLWGCIGIFMDVHSALESRLPWESMLDALGFVDTVRAMIFPIVLCGASYFGYRCVVNERQDDVIDLNRHINIILINAVLSKN